MKTEFLVPAKGVGRRDYTSGVEYATQATYHGFQHRVSWFDTFLEVPTIPYPEFYSANIYFFDEYLDIVDVAPRFPYHFFEILATTERHALLGVGFYRFASLADFDIWNVEKWYGTLFGYGQVLLNFSHGIKTEQGKVYAVSFAEYSAEPDFNIHWDINSVEETAILAP